MIFEIITALVMGQRGEAEIWLPSSFHCKFRFHGQLIFS